MLFCNPVLIVAPESVVHFASSPLCAGPAATVLYCYLVCTQGQVGYHKMTEIKKLITHGWWLPSASAVLSHAEDLLGLRHCNIKWKHFHVDISRETESLAESCWPTSFDV